MQSQLSSNTQRSSSCLCWDLCIFFLQRECMHSLKRKRQHPGSTCFLAGKPRHSSAGRRSQGAGPLPGQTSSPAAWECPYSGFLNECFVFNQMLSSVGKGALPPLFHCLHQLPNAVKQADKKSSYVNSFQKLNSVVGRPPTSSALCVHTHSETGYIQYRSQHHSTKSRIPQQGLTPTQYSTNYLISLITNDF